MIINFGYHFGFLCFFSVLFIFSGYLLYNYKNDQKITQIIKHEYILKFPDGRVFKKTVEDYEE